MRDPPRAPGGASASVYHVAPRRKQWIVLQHKMRPDNPASKARTLGLPWAAAQAWYVNNVTLVSILG